jgi:hypothetical protein
MLLPLLILLLSSCLVLVKLAERSQSKIDINGVIRTIIDSQKNTWNRGDGPGWVQAFRPDAAFLLTTQGDILFGRDQIQDHRGPAGSDVPHGSFLVNTLDGP